MADILTVLYALIKAQWNPSDADIDTIGNVVTETTKEVHLTTGWYDEAIIAPQVSITPVSASEPMQEIGYTHQQERILVDVGVWVQILEETGKGAGYAKKIAYELREEVKRIIRANTTATGIYDLAVYDWRFITETDLAKPVLHWVVTVKAEKTI